ncbi:CHAD domain-containing protein [Chitinibacter bivalviorum]|uniref:CHAD domain-containing protein n=1 Tax=Chitinibacter bivalviorum TaxID=2739434 RepID=A0A7H9BMV9_9NEIS|nr:CHAD domain-containing protein [Chitinibacter bivalviorum]QLG89558.1 CHAD domain-containing protein [Chitinibacter bivalviorum]
MGPKKQLRGQIEQLLVALTQLRTRLLAGATRDPETLHDFRVALRGLRTLLPLLLSKSDLLNAAIKAGWRELAQLSGPARDAEVMLAALPSQHPAARRLRAQKRMAYQQLIRRLQQVHWPVLHAATVVQLERQLRSRAVLHARIKRRTQRLTHQVRQLMVAPATPQQWHQLRIAIKRLRYLIEYTQHWQPRALLAIFLPLKQAQSVLGEMHDLDVRCAAGLVLPDDEMLRLTLQQQALQALAQLALPRE